jgi:hypothetical protein
METEDERVHPVTRDDDDGPTLRVGVGEPRHAEAPTGVIVDEEFFALHSSIASFK